MKWSGHAYTRALYRLRTDLFSLSNYIMNVDKPMQQISLKETEKFVTITSIHKGDKYFLAPHPDKDEKVLFIVNNGVLKTILTKDLDMLSKIPVVRRNGNLCYRNRMVISLVKILKEDYYE